MNYIGSLIEDLEAGEAPEGVLKDLEAYLTPLVGDLPDNRDDMMNWVNNTLAIFYLMRWIHLARYYPEGHKRTDLLHKAAGLLHTGSLMAPEKDQAIQGAEPCA